MRPPLNFVQSPPTPLSINMRAPRRIGVLGHAWAVQYSTGWTVYARRIGVVTQRNTEAGARNAVDMLVILLGALEDADQPDPELAATFNAANEMPDLDYDPREDEAAYGEPPSYWDRDRTEGA